MALKLQAVDDPATDQNFRRVGGRFPIQSKDLANSAKELFPQLVTAANRKINLGTTEVEFPGANNASNVKEVSHSIGAAPRVFFVCQGTTTSGVGGNYAELTAAPTSTVFKVRALNPFLQPNAADKLTILWIAIG